MACIMFCIDLLCLLICIHVMQFLSYNNSHSNCDALVKRN